jgi:hypothetical protein
VGIGYVFNLDERFCRHWVDYNRRRLVFRDVSVRAHAHIPKYECLLILLIMNQPGYPAGPAERMRPVREIALAR